jgi:hypothetical protein
MVQWKGNTQREQVGEKAASLESLEKFNVPNFFVLTKSEVGEFLESREPEEIANQKLPEDVVEEVREAYQDIGVSSEVRNASGEARNLVGNQRESQRVSVRISGNDNMAEYRLNVGASGLEESIRKVLSSYYRENSETPAIVFQKMIEPEYTGAVVNKYTRRHSLVEIVEGLGHSLEEGITVPEFYLLNNSAVQEKRIPGKQVKVSRNPMNGQRRTRTISKNSPTFQDSEIEDLARKASTEGLSVKFAYKRGSFYVVDAFDSKPMSVEPDLEALKVSEGEIKGREGRDYILSDETRKTEKPLVAKKGGYTSTDSQRKRKEGLPAVVSLQNTQKIKDSSSVAKQNKPEENIVRDISANFPGVTATEVRTVNEFPELSENPFSFQEKESKFAESCEQILSEDSSLIDARDIDEKALLKSIESVDAKVLAVEEVSDDLLEKVVEQGVEILAVPGQSIEKVSKRLLREEKRFIMRNIRN